MLEAAGTNAFVAAAQAQPEAYMESVFHEFLFLRNIAENVPQGWGDIFIGEEDRKGLTNRGLFAIITTMLQNVVAK